MVTTGTTKLSITHIVLKEPEKSEEYKERTEKAMEGRMPKRRESP